MKQKIIKNVQLRIEAPSYIHGVENDIRELKSLKEAIQNHKDLSGFNIWIEKEEVFICEFCKRDWEEEDDVRPMCCEKAVEERIKKDGQE